WRPALAVASVPMVARIRPARRPARRAAHARLSQGAAPVSHTPRPVRRSPCPEPSAVTHPGRRVSQGQRPELTCLRTDNLHTPAAKTCEQLRGKYSAFGAISQGCGARRRSPTVIATVHGMLLSASRLREFHAVGL